MQPEQILHTCISKCYEMNVVEIFICFERNKAVRNAAKHNNAQYKCAVGGIHNLSQLNMKLFPRLSQFRISCQVDACFDFPTLHGNASILSLPT